MRALTCLAFGLGMFGLVVAGLSWGGYGGLEAWGLPAVARLAQQECRGEHLEESLRACVGRALSRTSFPFTITYSIPAAY